jgi:hypothetical protein
MPMTMAPTFLEADEVEDNLADRAIFSDFALRTDPVARKELSKTALTRRARVKALIE